MKMQIVMNMTQLLGGIILSFGYIPQIMQTLRTKQVRDINLKYYINIFIGVLLMEMYAIYNFVHGTAAMFLVTNTIALSCCTTMMILTAMYKKRS